MTFVIYFIMFYCMVGAVVSLRNISTINLAQANLNNIMFLIQNDVIDHIRYRVYMNEFEDGGYKNRTTMVMLAQELKEIHDKWENTRNGHNENGLFRP